MTDHDLEQRLRAWYRADIGERESALRQLRTDLAMLAGTASSRRPLAAGWRIPALNRFAPLALAATAVIVAILIGIGLLVGSPDVGPSPIPVPTNQATPAPASWGGTGSMAEARTDFTATRLSDGSVLVTGGDRGPDAVPRALASAELYDPAGGTWTTTASMLTGRYRHSATLLADGRVLVAGGNVSGSQQAGSGCCLATAELYDPATGTWTATGRMFAARVDHTATLLIDGKVLVAGGASHNGMLASAELYDPSSGTWTATGAMVLATNGQEAVLLPNGKVLVMGGNAIGDSTELYNPSTGSWSDSGPTGGPNGTATLLRDGKVLVAGGIGIGGIEDPLASAVLYDPGNGSWTATGSMITPREFQTATLLLDGQVLVMGGMSWSDGDVYLPATAELYDLGNESWTATANMIEGRIFYAAVLLPDGTVLVAGGSDHLPDGALVLLASAELYDPGDGS